MSFLNELEKNKQSQEEPVKKLCELFKQQSPRVIELVEGLQKGEVFDYIKRVSSTGAYTIDSTFYLSDIPGLVRSEHFWSKGDRFGVKDLDTQLSRQSGMVSSSTNGRFVHPLNMRYLPHESYFFRDLVSGFKGDRFEEPIEWGLGLRFSKQTGTEIVPTYEEWVYPDVHNSFMYHPRKVQRTAKIPTYAAFYVRITNLDQATVTGSSIQKLVNPLDIKEFDLVLEQASKDLLTIKPGPFLI